MLLNSNQLHYACDYSVSLHSNCASVQVYLNYHYDYVQPIKKSYSLLQAAVMQQASVSSHDVIARDVG